MLKTQTDMMTTILYAYTYKELSERTGISTTRLHRLKAGTVEVTLFEAYALSMHTGFNLLAPDFVSSHAHDKPRPSRSVKDSH